MCIYIISNIHAITGEHTGVCRVERGPMITDIVHTLLTKLLFVFTLEGLGHCW